MAATADNLRELHALHQRAKALRDRMASAPKTLAARQKALDAKRTAVEAATRAIKDLRAQQKTKETSAQSLKEKTADLRTKLNSIKKQVEYDAIRNQIAHDNASLSKIEDETLELMGRVEEQSAAVAALDAEVKAAESDVAALKADIDAKAAQQKAQVDEIDSAIRAAEAIIPEDQRDQYQRNIKQRSSDAMADVDGGACTGCFVSVTAQMMNELINGGHLVFCKTCGRILYLAEQESSSLKRSGR